MSTHTNREWWINRPADPGWIPLPLVCEEQHSFTSGGTRIDRQGCIRDGRDRRTGYAVIDLVGDVERVRRCLSSMIVADWPKKERAAVKAEYDELLSGRADRATAHAIERALRMSIADLRPVVSKRRTANEQHVYDRLARYVLGQSTLDKPSLARVLQCHPRTIERLIQYAAQEAQNVNAAQLERIEQRQEKILRLVTVIAKNVQPDQGVDAPAVEPVTNVVDFAAARRRLRKAA